MDALTLACNIVDPFVQIAGWTLLSDTVNGSVSTTANDGDTTSPQPGVLGRMIAR